MSVPAAKAVVAEGGAPRQPPVPPGTHITIRGLNKAFGGEPVYAGFDLDLPKGKITSVFGPNGCGKSTLIDLIAGLFPIDSGYLIDSYEHARQVAEPLVPEQATTKAAAAAETAATP